MIDIRFIFQQLKVKGVTSMKNIHEEPVEILGDDEAKESIKPEKILDEENSISCQIRRKIEDYLEKRYYKDELGDFDEELA